MTEKGTQVVEDDERDHLDDIDDGSGCTEIWEQLSERREEDAATDPERAEE